MPLPILPPASYGADQVAANEWSALAGWQPAWAALGGGQPVWSVENGAQPEWTALGGEGTEP